ncbi:MAG: O-antigen ligase family protein [Candidatus Eisenbacteria bacterium]
MSDFGGIGRRGFGRRTGGGTWKILVFLGVFVAAGVASVLLFLPPEIGFAAAVSVVPLVAIALAVLRRPYHGVLLIFVLEYLRPQQFLPGLQAVRVPLLANAGLFLVLLARVIRDPKHSIVWPRQATTLAILLVFMAVSVITSRNNFWAFQEFRVMGTIVMFFLLTVNYVDTPSRMRRLIAVFVAVHVVLCVKGITEFLLAGGRGTLGLVGGAFLGDQNDFALAINVIFPFAYFAAASSRGAAKKTLWGFIALLFLITIMLTMSRGGFVGIAAVLIACWIRSRRKIRGAVALALLVGTVALIAPSRYFDEIRTIQQTDEGTAHKRREFWLAGLRMFAEKPLIGVGPGNSSLLMPLYVDLPEAGREWGRAMHGTLPLLLAEMGTVGAILYGALFFQSVGDLRRTWREGKRGPERRRFAEYMVNATGVSILGFLVTSTFLSALTYPHIYVLVSFCFLQRRIAVGSDEEAFT